MIAEILIDLGNASLNKCFDYTIPANLIHLVQKGIRVVVYFNNVLRLGYIVDVKEKSLFANKPIIEILDKTPILNQELFLLIDEILKVPFSVKVAAYRTVLPKSFLVSYVKKIIFLQPDLIPINIKQYLQKNKFLLNTKNYGLMKQVMQLKARNIIKMFTIPKKELLSLSYDNMKTLIEQEREHHIMDLADLHGTLYITPPKTIILNEQQQALWNKINFFTYQTYLFYHEHDPDKMQIYFKLIEQNLINNRQVLILLPEIILIKSFVKEIRKIFKNISISILNGDLNKLENFRRNIEIHQQKIDLVIGTRIAIFAPLHKLGIIIIDEEHNEAFIEKDRIPNYDTKELARIRAVYHQIPLILSSFAPSLESYYKVKLNEYQSLILKNQKYQIPMKLIDMKQELKNNNFSPFSVLLMQTLIRNIQTKKKSLLFINSKGFAPFVLCRFCNYVPKCRKCYQSLRFYHSENSLKCGLCNYKEIFCVKCPYCLQNALRSVSLGIEYIESFLKQKFPLANILRLDSNTFPVFKLKQYEKILKDSEQTQIDIFLGTQMITKNLPLPHISLVGVIMTDILLNIPHFTAAEKTFQLLIQMARKCIKENSIIIVQSYNIQHYVLQSAVNYDIDYFYSRALKERKIYNYPPFVFVSQILIMHKYFKKAWDIAHQIKIILAHNGLSKIKILGPYVPFISEKNVSHKSVYRVFLTLKYINWPLDLNFLKKYKFHKDAFILFNRFANVL
ncbi:replication restart helicase PriA [Candidatus Phytoplasma melaleucae]|uniref:Replication restart protein PriA n=1 Tax=Candidatus Phytoplasma melaleucae TaxID=2982630 RepID=A0ABT9DCY8_9MOLU|nr:primosomal protein N' ['Melaleuca sp.' phytoplasma]MDO8167957.1 primosomal protein N' ['Melaleuca sp.' phytoplasma]